MCTYIAVMYLGQIVELALSEPVCTRPWHPYSLALFSAALPQRPRDKGGEVLAMGEIPSPLNPPPGCHFHPRCRYAQSICSEKEPDMRELTLSHYVACHFAESVQCNSDLSPS